MTACAWARAYTGHKDNVRIDNMWGTLVIQLPSEYQGARLHVYSPSTPDEACSYDFSSAPQGEETGKRRVHHAAPERAQPT